MATIRNRALFFTTSPRTPSKMIPEIDLLYRRFSGQTWNAGSQIAFIDALAETEFFQGKGSDKDKAFSARDRITRAPKALGFVDLEPAIAVTDAGRAFVYGKRPQEAFLRQLLKFQLPSPYHREHADIQGSFRIRPYLEMMRLIHDLGHLTFDEVKIFALQLTDYRQYPEIQAKILDFRNRKEENRGRYKQLVHRVLEDELRALYADDLSAGNTKTRESADRSEAKFLDTKRSNLRDYADACFRYLRFTGLFSISYRGHSISVAPECLPDVEYILETVDPNPVFTTDPAAYKRHLFDARTPSLYSDNREHLTGAILRFGLHAPGQLSGLGTDALRDLFDQVRQGRQARILSERVTKIKAYQEYAEIADLFAGIRSKSVFDPPLMLEYNTWRAMTMLNGGTVRANLRFDDFGEPLSTAPGNMPDIECDYPDFALSVEVTMQAGQKQFEAEGESVARHYGKLKERSGKETYCLFIAPSINQSTLAHFYGLAFVNISLYGGKAKIIPLPLALFEGLLAKAYRHDGPPGPEQLRQLLDDMVAAVRGSADENDWAERIATVAGRWLG